MKSKVKLLKKKEEKLKKMKEVRRDHTKELNANFLNIKG